MTGAAPGRDGATAGFAQLDEGNDSYNPRNRTLRLTVLRSLLYANHTPFVLEQGMTYPAIDQGIQRFIYALAPHLGPRQHTDMAKSVLLINQAPVVLPETIHEGLLPRSAFFARVEGVDAVLTAMKLAKDGSWDVIVHLYLITRNACRGMLRLPLALHIPRDAAQLAYEVDFTENPMV